LSGLQAGSTANGISVRSGNVTVKGFVINHFAQYGISLDCPSAVCDAPGSLSVYGSYIGTDTTGSVAIGNKGGIYLRAHESLNDTINPDSHIGGTGANERNVISGNHFNGIVVNSPETWTDIRIVNNYIGTNASGSAAVPNGTNGIYVLGTFDSVYGSDTKVYIGGASIPERNVISGNRENGIQLDEHKFKTRILGNHIGTNASGVADVGNAHNGVFVNKKTSILSIEIGGTTAGAGKSHFRKRPERNLLRRFAGENLGKSNRNKSSRHSCSSQRAARNLCSRCV
jgi:hypothetical protein